MLFKPDSNKPAQEVLSSRKNKVQIHPTINLNNIQVERTSYQKHLRILLNEKLNSKQDQKHLRILLNEKLNSKQDIDSVIPKISKGISIIKKLRHSLPRKLLFKIYKAFLGPLIDYGDIIYDQPQNEFFCEKLESVQYKAATAITGVMQATSRNKI